MVLLCLASSVAAQVAASPGRADARITREIAVAAFDTAWGRINALHYDSTFNGVDWAAVRTELRPRAAAAATIGELRAVIADMLRRLGESHYSLIPGEIADAVDPASAAAGEAERGGVGDVGMALRLVGDRIVVWRLDPEGPAAGSGAKAGWLVEAIGENRMAEAIARMERLEPGAPRRNALTQLLWNLNAQLEGPPGSRIAVRFLDEQDRSVTLQLERRKRPGEPIRFGNLPTFLAELEYRRIAEGEGCIGFVRFNIWMVPLVPRFDRAMDELRDCRGIIIDLRGNPGGIAGMVMGIAGHFLAERLTLGTMRSRRTVLNFVANPRTVSASGRRVAVFAGPLAVLVDGLSVSTSEFFAGGMQAVGRARVFGETTAGQALPAVLVRLPSGDVLMHVVADFTAAGGVRIEGRGVIPDVLAPLRRDELLAGRDGALDAALRWVREQSADTSG